MKCRYSYCGNLSGFLSGAQTAEQNTSKEYMEIANLIGRERRDPREEVWTVRLDLS